MTLAWDNGDTCVGEVAEQEVPVLGWARVVFGPFPDMDRCSHFVECEPPGVAEDPVVLEAPGRSLAHRLLDEGDRVGDRPPLLQRGRVDARKAPADLAIEAGLGRVGDRDTQEG